MKMLVVIMTMISVALASDLKFDSYIAEQNGVKYLCSDKKREVAIRNMIDECKEVKERNLLLEESIKKAKSDRVFDGIKNGIMFFGLGFVTSTVLIMVKK